VEWLRVPARTITTAVTVGKGTETMATMMVAITARVTAVTMTARMTAVTTTESTTTPGYRATAE
jgi:hypothetical protein